MREFPKEFFWFEGERILLRRLVNRQKRLMATIVREVVITNKNLYMLRQNSAENLLYTLGILNSKLMSRFYLSQVSQATKDDFPQVTIRDILNLPYKTTNFSDPTDKARHDKMVKLVEQMLDLNRKLAAAKLAHERTALERQIAATDKQIDALVYELYGLTKEEIEIVESS
jgi:hypothetical protein